MALGGYRKFIRDDIEGSGSWREQLTAPSTTYTIECEVNGTYEIYSNGHCTLQLPDTKHINRTCSEHVTGTCTRNSS